MTVLQIYLSCLDGKEAEFEARFRDTFLPAISVQKGLLHTSMLRSVDVPLSYQIEFAFESEELRQGWVHSQEHQHALPIIKSLCGEASFARFDVVHKTA
jgi:heme-degrading monooxygenase HmoA